MLAFRILQTGSVATLLGCGTTTAHSSAPDSGSPSHAGPSEAGAFAKDSGAMPTDGGGNPWADCSGSHGVHLSCQSHGAHAVSGSRYDPSRGCFKPVQALGDLCAVPTYCPGGGGELTCFVSAGSAYAAYVLYGEELTNPAWHHDAHALMASTLTAGEQALCDELWRAIQALPGEADAGGVLIDDFVGIPLRLSPACSD